MEERLRGVWRKDLGCVVVLVDYEKSPLKDLRGIWKEDLRGVWREDLGCFAVLGDYEKSPLKDLWRVWRKDLGEYGGST